MKPSLKIVNRLIFLFTVLPLFSQVGINTSDPQTTLHIEGEPNSMSTLDGFLLPRITASQLSAKTYTNNQNGTLIFVTDNNLGTSQAINVNGRGIYYFDSNSSTWIATTGGTVIGADGELEAVGSGYRIRGRSPALYVNPGTEAVDLSESTSSPSGASGNNSFTVGRNTTATANRSFAAGLGTSATSRESFAIGQNSIASGRASLAIGRNTSATAESSFAGGDGSDATEFSAYAFGFNTTASGNTSFAIGRGTEASGTASIATGNDTVSSGSNSISGGNQSNAGGNNSLAFGDNTLATASQSFSAGSRTEATGVNSFAVGSFSTAGGTNTVAMGSDSEALADGSVVLGSSVSVRAMDNGSFYFGDDSGSSSTSTASNRIHMRFSNGYNFYTNINANVGARLQAGATAWTSISDKRSKQNIEKIPYGLETVLNLNPTIYSYKDTGVVSMGFIAQEVIEVIPEVVDVPQAKDEYLGIKYTEIIPVLTKAIQEQQTTIEKQALQLKELTATLQSIEVSYTIQIEKLNAIVLESIDKKN